MCVCDSLVYDGAGDKSGVEVVDDVVACVDDTLLTDAFRVGGWLSVVGQGVAQRGWVDGLIYARRFPVARTTTYARNVLRRIV